MRRVIAVLLVMMMIASLAACGAKEEPETQSAQSSESMQAQEPEVTEPETTEPEVTESETTEPETTEPETTEPEAAEAENLSATKNGVTVTVPSATEFLTDLPADFSEEAMFDGRIYYGCVGNVGGEKMGFEFCNCYVPQALKDGEDMKSIVEKGAPFTMNLEGMEVQETTVAGLNGYVATYMEEGKTWHNVDFCLEAPDGAEGYYLFFNCARNNEEVDRDKLDAFLEAFLENATFTYAE